MTANAMCHDTRHIEKRTVDVFGVGVVARERPLGAYALGLGPLGLHRR